MKYEAYLHINGGICIKKLTPFGSLIESNSPFIEKHLPIIEAINYEEAKNKYKTFLKGV